MNNFLEGSLVGSPMHSKVVEEVAVVLLAVAIVCCVARACI